MLRCHKSLLSPLAFLPPTSFLVAKFPLWLWKALSLRDSYLPKYAEGGNPEGNFLRSLDAFLSPPS